METVGGMARRLNQRHHSNSSQNGQQVFTLETKSEIPEENAAKKWKTSFIEFVVATEGAALARQNVISASQYLPQIKRLPQLRNPARLRPIKASPRAKGLGGDSLGRLRLLSR